MKQQLYEIDCDPTCGFKIISHDKEETKDFAKDHVMNVHDKATGNQELEKMLMMV